MSRRSTVVVATLSLVGSVCVSLSCALAADPLQLRNFDERRALVIGNSNYAAEIGGPLRGPENEAKAIAAALVEAGFKVTTLVNTNLATLESGIANFYKAGTTEQTLNLVYYTGHGATVEGQSYLIPIDANIGTVDAFKSSSVHLSKMVAALQGAESQNVIVLDAGRNDPFPKERTRGFVPVRKFSADNVVFMYSSLSGFSASDAKGEEPISPFAKFFIKNLARPGIEWSEFAVALTLEMLDATNGDQRPAVEGLPQRFRLTRLKEMAVSESRLDSDAGKRLGRVVLLDQEREIPVYKDGSYALLVGVSDYDNEKIWPKLPGVSKDINTIEEVLRTRHGFETMKVIDPSDTELEAAFKRFIRLYGPRENARLLIFYAGHGYTTRANGYSIGWLVPRNSPDPVGAPEAFAVTALSMRRINEYSEIIKAKHVLWLFDSCFSGSVFDMAPTRSREEALPTYFDRPIRRVITSGSADEEVPDTSVFTELLLAGLKGELAVGRRKDVFTDVELGEFLGELVHRYRDKRQTPQSGVVPLRGLDRGRVVFQVPGQVTK